MRSPKFRSALLALLGGLIATAPAAAFRLIQNTATGTVTAGAQVTCNDVGGFAHWSTLSTGWWLNLANQGSNKSTSVRNALESWNDVTTAGHVLTYNGSTTAQFTTDSTNTISWGTSGACTSSCLAVTALTLQAGQLIVEADILFRNDLTWTTNGAQYDTEGVLAHELGHALGIHHSEITTTPRPTMYPSYIGSDGRSLHADDAAALACAYNRYHGCTAPPAEPSNISGPNHDLCQGKVETYTVPHVPGADTYRWEVVGEGVVRTTTNNEVSLSGHYFDPGAYTLQVRAQNACGNSTWYDATIFVLPNTDPSCGGCSGRICP